MPKKREQKTVWVPIEEWHKLEKDYEENEQMYRLIGIDSAPELFRVLARLGKDRLQRLLAQVSSMTENSGGAIEDILAELRTLRKTLKESQQ